MFRFKAQCCEQTFRRLLRKASPRIYMAHTTFTLKEVTVKWLNSNFSPLFFCVRMSSVLTNINRWIYRILVCVWRCRSLLLDLFVLGMCQLYCETLKIFSDSEHFFPILLYLQAATSRFESMCNTLKRVCKL